MLIFIPGTVPSSKNSKVWTGRFLVTSKAVKKYIVISEPYWKSRKLPFKMLIAALPKPLKIGFHFVRNSRHKYDFVNPLQTVQDLMVTYEWLEDDNMEEMVPIPFKKKGQFSTYDKEKPGVYIKIFK